MQFPLGGIHQSPLRALTRAPFITWEVAHLHFEVSRLLFLHSDAGFCFLEVFLLFGVVFPMFVLQEKKNQMNDLHPGVEFTDVVLEEGGFERQRIPEIFFLH